MTSLGLVLSKDVSVAKGYTVDKVDEVDETECKCSSCSWRGFGKELKPVIVCDLTPGDASPAGRCPKCAQLAYPNRELDRARLNAEGLFFLLREFATVNEKLSAGAPMKKERVEEMLVQAKALLRSVKGRKMSGKGEEKEEKQGD